MRIFSLPTILSIAGAIAAGALLFWTSQNVQREEDRLAALRDSVASERQSIRVLHAEWDYLNRPGRLAVLAHEYLGLSSAGHFTVSDNIDDIPDMMIPALPQHKPVLAVRPVALKAPAAPEPPVRPRTQDNRSFQELLNGLGRDEGGAP